MLNTRFDRLVNPLPNNGQVDPHGVAYEQEESIADDEILRQEGDTFDERQSNRLNFNRQGMRGNNFSTITHMLVMIHLLRLILLYHVLRVPMMLENIYIGRWRSNRSLMLI